jgi:hypothetical protein
MSDPAVLSSNPELHLNPHAASRSPLRARAHADELATGQLVIVVARWLLVLVGLLVAVWNPDPLPRLRIQIAVILVVAIANFVMHAQLLRRRPTLEIVAYAASLGDLLVISLLVASQGGFASNVFVFYFPAMLAISVAFPTAQAVVLTAIGVCLALGVSLDGQFDAASLLLRGLALAAAAVIGNAYWRLHRERILPSASTRREAAEDLFWGQSAAIWARWSVVIGGAALVLSQAADTTQLAIAILPVVVLLIANFYLHGRYLVEKPANAWLTLLASGLDLAMLALLFFSWTGAPGLGNPAYLLLYPIVISVGLVFPPRISWSFTAVALGLYVVLAQPVGDPKVLVVRLITLGAVCGLSSLYWRSVRARVRIGGGDDAVAPVAWQSAVAS